MLRDLDWVKDRLRWMREQRIWSNGLRYLWTDAFGVVLLVSLYHELNEERYLAEAEHGVAEVDRVLGRPRGVRIGEAERAPAVPTNSSVPGTAPIGSGPACNVTEKIFGGQGSVLHGNAVTLVGLTVKAGPVEVAVTVTDSVPVARTVMSRL